MWRERCVCVCVCVCFETAGCARAWGDGVVCVSGVTLCVWKETQGCFWRETWGRLCGGRDGCVCVWRDWGKRVGECGNSGVWVQVETGVCV